MGTGQGGLRTGWFAAFGTEGYEGEPPLLEELGVNFGHIQMKTLTVLNPMARIDQHIMDDADLAGPFLFCALFGTFLLLVGLLHNFYNYARTNTVTVRQALVRIRLRSRSTRRHQSTLRLQHDVSTSIAGRSQRRTEPPSRLPRQLALLFHPDSWSLEFRARILPPTSGLRQLTRCRTPSRHIHRILPRQSCNRLVHILEQCHVLRGWSHDEHARTRRVSSRVVLCRIRHHGRLFLEGNRQDRSDDQCQGRSWATVME